MPTNVFYRLNSQRGTKLVTLPGSICTLKEFWDCILLREGINDTDFLIGYGPKLFRPISCNLETVIIRNDSHIDILVPLVGGKGGFGSLLRAIGAQIEKTTNRDACRDLQGRRLRDVKKEDELRKLIALQEKLLEERKRRKVEKLEKLRKSAKQTETSLSIQVLIDMFEDKEYNERRHNIGDIIDAAVSKGIINSKKRQNDELDLATDDNLQKKLKTTDECPKVISESSDDIVDEKANSDIPCDHEKTQQTPQPTHNDIDNNQSIKCKTNNLWLGLESDDEENDSK